MTRKHATVEQVARLAGVSTATVSRVLNGTAVVAADTERRVREAIDQLAFNPAPQARNLRTGRTGNIALIVPSITNPFFPELMAHVNREVRGRDYSLLLFDSPEPEDEGVRVARSRLADGIILVGSTSPAAVRPPLQITDVPVVAFDRRPQALSAPVVQVDNYRGAREIVRHLGARGHRRIAFIAGPRGVSVSADRARGYRAGLRDLDIAPDQDLITAGEFDEDSGYAAAVRLLSPAPPAFTAVFAANDLMAIGAMSALRDQGVAIPGQIAVAGFDGIHLGRYVAPSLTTYAQPTADLARRAVELLAAAISGSPASPSRTLRLAGSLIVRDSTGPAAPD